MAKYDITYSCGHSATIQLYGKNERDNAILFGLTKMISVIDMNNILFDLGLELLV